MLKHWCSEQHVLTVVCCGESYNLIKLLYSIISYYSANAVLALPDKNSCVSAVSAIPPIPLNLLSLRDIG